MCTKLGLCGCVCFGHTSFFVRDGASNIIQDDDDAIEMMSRLIENGSAGDLMAASLAG